MRWLLGKSVGIGTMMKTETILNQAPTPFLREWHGEGAETR